MQKVRKAIFPVGGLGTRFLPATKALPKEMLPIVDKPLIQYAVEEAAEAGIEEFIFVTGRNKSAIEDHFDHSFELEATLTAKKQTTSPRYGATDGAPPRVGDLCPPARTSRIGTCGLVCPPLGPIRTGCSVTCR